MYTEDSEGGVRVSIILFGKTMKNVTHLLKVSGQRKVLTTSIPRSTSIAATRSMVLLRNYYLLMILN